MREVAYSLLEAQAELVPGRWQWIVSQ